MTSISAVVTGGYFIGKKITVNGITEDTTILQFIQLFSSQIGFSHLRGSLCTEFFGKSDFSIEEGIAMEFDGNEKKVLESTFCGSTCITCVIKEANRDKKTGQRIRMFINWNQQTRLICLHTDETIADLKVLVNEKTGISPAYQRLIFKGKELRDDHKLSWYNICDDSELYLATRLRGGGVREFVDVTSDWMEKIKFTVTAPAWRICCNGLSIEGICKNVKCDAHNQMVLSPQGYITYNMTTDVVKCPACFVPFEPIRPMFYKCVVVYNGLKSDGMKIQAPPKTFTDSDGVTSYDMEKSGTCSYKYLIIQVTEPDNVVRNPLTNTDVVVPRICYICHSNLHKEKAKFLGFCDHAFHQECLEKWKEVSSQCPLCFLNFAGI